MSCHASRRSKKSSPIKAPVTRKNPIFGLVFSTKSSNFPSKFGEFIIIKRSTQPGTEIALYEEKEESKERKTEREKKKSPDHKMAKISVF